MTREEIIKEYETAVATHAAAAAAGIKGAKKSYELFKAGLNALRPVSREQVEKMRGEWMFPIFTDQKDANDPRCQCSECGSIETPLARHRFCPSCGRPMTDEAVQMVMERMEALYEQKV